MYHSKGLGAIIKFASDVETVHAAKIMDLYRRNRLQAPEMMCFFPDIFPLYMQMVTLEFAVFIPSKLARPVSWIGDYSAHSFF